MLELFPVPQYHPPLPKYFEKKFKEFTKVGQCELDILFNCSYCYNFPLNKLCSHRDIIFELFLEERMKEEESFVLLNNETIAIHSQRFFPSVPLACSYLVLKTSMYSYLNSHLMKQHSL